MIKYLEFLDHQIYRLYLRKKHTNASTQIWIIDKKSF